MIYCDWEGFAWVWSFEKKSWLIDLEKSGGPPSIHEPSPSEPPFKVSRTDGKQDTSPSLGQEQEAGG